MNNETLALIRPPIRTSCFPNENPISYLARLANLNEYPSYRWLLSGKSAGTINYKRLYDVLVEAEWTGYQKTDPVLEEICSLPSIHINSARLRYCPLCLQEESYWRIGWQLKLSVACTKHQIWLHDHCPTCHGDQSSLKANGNQCKCGEQLSNAEAVPAPPPSVRIQQFLEKGLVNPENSLFDIHLPPTTLERCELMEFMLKWLKIGKEQDKPGRQKFKCVTDFSVNAVECAEALLSDQSGFWRYLQTIHLSNASYIGIQQKRLIQFYRQFLKEFSEPAFRPLREVVENYITMHLVRDITEKHTLFSPDAKKVQLWYSCQKACTEYGIASSLLSRAITDKQIRVYRESSNRGYTKCAVYRPDLEKILPHLRGLIPACNAAEILGVTKAQFSQLQNCGCFNFEVPPRQDYCSTWQYSKQELETFIENINKGAARATSDSLTLSQVMQNHMRGSLEMPFLQVIKAILSGQLVVRKSDSQIQKIRDLLVDKKEFTDWLKKVRPDPGYMSVTDASRLLGINEEFSYQLVNRGYLQHKIDSRNAKVIFPDHIRQFEQEYVILSKLSRDACSDSATVIERLDATKIFPVDHNDSDKLRQRLYARADVLKSNWYYRYVQHLPTR